MRSPTQDWTWAKHIPQPKPQALSKAIFWCIFCFTKKHGYDSGIIQQRVHRTNKVGPCKDCGITTRHLA